MTLVEKYALLPDDIDRQSLRMVEESLPPLPSLTPEERYLVCRIVRAEGDPAIAHLVRFRSDAVRRGITALQMGATVITDARMVEAGISKALLTRCGVTTRCVIDAPAVAQRAQQEQTSRSVAAIRELAPFMNGCIVAVGNAPTALLALLDLIDDGAVSPALVIGMPVGFVACPESKAELIQRSIPYIAIEGRRGGSSAASATVNALLSLSLS